MSPIEKDFELKYSHNIIEHLGLKLYQNRPTNVLAELISNSWDADATNVWIDLNKDNIAVADNGTGMTREILLDNYLVIGKRKRKQDELDAVSGQGRKFMGRKGIGKLAPFGIAQKLSLITIDKQTSLCYWIELDIAGLLKDSDNDVDIHLSYKPDVICDGVPIAKIPLDKDDSGHVAAFLDRITQNDSTHGTLIIMSNLSIKRAINDNSLKQSIGQRFTVTLLKDDFKVFVNNSVVTEEEAMPNFAIRYPESGYTSEIINVNGINREVRHWVGFIEEADWPQDQAGVGIYAHGKIAQDRPFVFGLKGREISTRYMYGVIEADWLDELNEDIVSTDRTSINWNNDETEPMYGWGKQLVASWINEYRKHQKSIHKDKIDDKLKTLPDLPKVTEPERIILRDMVCNMSPKVFKDDNLQNEILHNLTSAWTHRPTRKIVQNLWDKIENSEDNEPEFLAILNDINKYLVPESLSLSVTVAQKIYALTRLNELSKTGTENQLQSLLENFPWILGSDKGKVYANLSLKSIAKKAALESSLPSHGHTKEKLKQLSDLPGSSTRPDFSFFNDENQKIFYVVELKNPQIPLERSHLMQLHSYVYWLMDMYPDATVYGYLIGKNTGNAIKSTDIQLQILTWMDLCLQSRKDYLELLASMLHGISDHEGDSRMNDILEFGGEPTKELLQKMINADSPLKDFIDNIEQKIGK